MLELLEYLVLGIGVGTVGALLGLGGGFILVPIFMLFMIAPHGSTFTTVQQVVGTSLFAVFCNAISGTFAYIRQRRILMRAAVPFALATLPGAFLGGYLSEWFSGPGFSPAFGILMVFIGYIMYSKSCNGCNKEMWRLILQRRVSICRLAFCVLSLSDSCLPSSVSVAALFMFP